jgi:orotidine-5'-phosphate decarboxylase
MIDLAGSTGRGVVVVCRSSNPEGRSLQEARTDGGRGPAVEDMLLAGIAQLNRGGRVPPGTVGAVVGATLGPSEFRLAELGGVILAPGVGAQGGTAAGVGALFGECPAGSVLASSSRSLLARGPEVAALSEAAMKARDQMADVLG